jgi:D-beta-D-heptose 7-phosphate kinase/D-beta-D-heptose 1-phosphate adenosyltransferase
MIMLPTRPRAVYDVTGAGDMVLSVLGLVLAAGGGFTDAARLANVAGGLEVERVGVTPLTRKEIADALTADHASPQQKLKTLPELLKALDEHRRRGERVVFTNGCFDVLHVGHIQSLEAARLFGDVLVVGLNSDESVKRLKGPDRPIYNQKERAEILAALADVTYVAVFDDDTPLKLIEAVRPDVLVKGRDWKNAGVVGQEFVESHGGRVELVDLVTGVSTTDIITRVLKCNSHRGEKP